MKFSTGDAVVHPVRGAGIVERIGERVWQGTAQLHYTIRLLGQSGTRLMIPASVAEAVGVRSAIPRSELAQLWCVLLSAPTSLPSDAKELQQYLQGKLATGDVYQVAEVVRDVAWRQLKTHSNATAKQLYEDGIRLLVGEIAVTQGVEFVAAEEEVLARLRERMCSPAVV